MTKFVTALLFLVAVSGFSQITETYVYPNLGFGTEGEMKIMLSSTIVAPPDWQPALVGPMSLFKCGEVQVTFPTCDPTKYTWCKPRFDPIFCVVSPKDKQPYPFHNYGPYRPVEKVTPTVMAKYGLSVCGNVPAHPSFCAGIPPIAFQNSPFMTYLCAHPELTQPVYCVAPKTAAKVDPHPFVLLDPL